MWNVAMLDGEWLWFDATSDRGNSSEYGFLRFALTELDETKYQYAEQVFISYRIDSRYSAFLTEMAFIGHISWQQKQEMQPFF